MESLDTIKFFVERKIINRLHKNICSVWRLHKMIMLFHGLLLYLSTRGSKVPLTFSRLLVAIHAKYPTHITSLLNNTAIIDTNNFHEKPSAMITVGNTIREFNTHLLTQPASPFSFDSFHSSFTHPIQTFPVSVILSIFINNLTNIHITSMV